MKSLFTLIFLVITTHSFAQGTTGLQEVEGLFKALKAHWVEHYYLDFHIEKKARHKARRIRCEETVAVISQVITNIKEIHIKALELMVEQQLIEPAEKSNQRLAMTRALRKLALEIGDAKVTVCTEVDYPAYSDGHTTVVVKLERQVLFVYEVGYPD
jgi:hypothetical protein